MTTLSRHHALALSMSLVSTSLTVLALFLPFSHISERCRSPVLVCCWMALVASGPLWTYIGGSAASFFLVSMPYATSVGISIGLLWYCCVSKRGCLPFGVLRASAGWHVWTWTCLRTVSMCGGFTSPQPDRNWFVHVCCLPFFYLPSHARAVFPAVVVNPRCLERNSQNNIGDCHVS